LAWGIIARGNRAETPHKGGTNKLNLPELKPDSIRNFIFYQEEKQYSVEV
jgi:hypothetical protein